MTRPLKNRIFGGGRCTPARCNRLVPLLLAVLLCVTGCGDRTRLRAAVRRGDISYVEHWWHQGTNDIGAYTPGKDGNTLLHEAVMGGHAEMTRYLCTWLSMDEKNKAGETPVDLARRLGNKQVLHVLLEKELIHASWTGDTASVRRLISDGADVNHPAYNERSALATAARGNRLQVVGILLDAGADINARGGEYTPLEASARYNRIPIAKLLLKRGADPNVTNTVGYTALTYAATNDHAEMVRLLLASGADINAHSWKGDTALIRASLWGLTGMVTLLLDHGASPNARNDYGETALLLAAGAGRKETVALLLSRGADPNIKDNNGVTPLAKVRSIQHREVAGQMIALLTAHGAR